MDGIKKILTINYGSTSTKLAYFHNDQVVARFEESIGADVIDKCRQVLQQLPFRRQSVIDFIKNNNINVAELDMIVSRGGTIHGLHTGPYEVDEHLLAVHKYAPRAQMPSLLAAIVGAEIAEPYGIPVIIYDAPSGDDADEIMHITGIKGLRRRVTTHALNGKFVAHAVADEIGKPYEECNFIVAHLGGGITIGFHHNGRIIDSVMDDAGPISPQRAGRAPIDGLVDMCFSGKYTKQEVMFAARGGGGIVALLGTQDTREVEKRIADGDEYARQVYEYVAYTVAKGIAELSVADFGKIDAIILTGGIAKSKMFTEMVSKRVEFLAPVKIIPGEQEMLALARGGLRVLSGQETPQKYTWWPEGINNIDEFMAAYAGNETK